MNAKLFALLAVAFGVISFLTVGTVRAAEQLVLQSAGCKTEYFLLQDLAAAYDAKSGTKMKLGDTGNKKAVDLLIDKKIDFAFTCKTIEQLTKGLQLDPAAVAGWTSIPIAKDPIVILANPKNGVTGLSTAQLTEIFQGKVTNWKDVGGNDLPIMISTLDPALESGIIMLFREFTVGEEGALHESDIVGNPSMIGNYVAMTPGGLTFMGLTSYQEKFGPILAVDGVLPNLDNILNGSYKLAATYYLTITGGESKDVADFVRFVESEEGRAVIARKFIPFGQ